MYYRNIDNDVIHIMRELPIHLRKEYQYQEDNPFVDTYRFSPVAMSMDLPALGDPYYINNSEWDMGSKKFIERLDACTIDEMWWYKHRERCLYGYTIKNARKDGSSVTITGRHYFYLNFWWIYGKSKNSKVKTLTRPKFIDVDYIFFWKIEAMLEEGKDDEEIKARQKGYSEKIAGGCIAYNYTFVSYSQNIIVAGSDADADHTMQNVIRGLDQLRNTQFYKERGRDSIELIQAERYGSEIHKLTAGSQGMQSVSRFSPYFIIYEEVGKWPKGLAVSMRQFVDASLWNEGARTGYAIYIGTGGDMDGGAADLEKMYNAPANYNLLEFPDINEPMHMRSDKPVASFTPAWMYAIIDVDGNSLKEESIAFHEKNIENLKEGERFLYRVNNPNYASDAFMIPTGGYFGKEIVSILTERRSEIIKHSELADKVMWGNTYWRDPKDWSKGVYFKEGVNENGVVMAMITEEPKIDPSTGLPYINLYKQTTDSYDRDAANTSTSLGSTLIFHGFFDANSDYNYEVARLTVRPETFEGGAEKFFEEVLKLNILFNSINLIEYSNLRIFDFYKNHGFNSSKGTTSVDDIKMDNR